MHKVEDMNSTALGGKGGRMQHLWCFPCYVAVILSFSLVLIHIFSSTVLWELQPKVLFLHNTEFIVQLLSCVCVHTHAVHGAGDKGRRGWRWDRGIPGFACANVKRIVHGKNGANSSQMEKMDDKKQRQTTVYIHGAKTSMVLCKSTHHTQWDDVRKQWQIKSRGVW